MIIPTTDLKLLKKSLPNNWAEILSQRNKCSTSHIYKVLSGMRENDAIIADAYKLAKETQDENARVQQGIKKLSTSNR